MLICNALRLKSWLPWVISRAELPEAKIVSSEKVSDMDLSSADHPGYLCISSKQMVLPPMSQKY
jgi:hypothetical protein